ncbi:MAG: hypothetical protein EAZ97_11235 [Bacteroidetes bacterium]|nr:MAG: hypothetical protein EAZ97_11235 [Bacteroidota bacterium]
MKKVFIFVFFYCLFANTFLQAQDNYHLIARKFKVVSIISPDAKNFKPNLKGAFMEYKTDGTFTGNVQAKAVNGTWKLIDGDSGLLRKDKDGTQMKQKIVLANRNKVILSYLDKKLKYTLTLTLEPF